MVLYGVVISICITGIIGVFLSFYETGKQKTFIKERLTKALLNGDTSGLPDSHSSPLTEILSKKTEKLTKRFVPINVIKNLEKKILTASIKNMTVAKFFLTKLIIIFFVLFIIPALLISIGSKVNFGYLLLGLILGFFLPDMDLKSKIEKRHQTIMKELPNYIDLLRVCIESGMDLESSLHKLAEKSTGALKDETLQTISEIKMGKAINEALQDMTARIDLADLTSFVTLLIQANQMGISISNVLRTQADQISLKYVQAQRAKAAKVPVLILMPMVFFIMPSLLVVILGPIVISLISAF